MVNMKPSYNGKDDTEITGGFYDGPPPTPGTYTGTVEKLGLAKIGSGDNKGEDRLALLVRISEGKFKGAGIFHSLNLTKQGAPFVNQFLHSLTDGTDKKKEIIRTLFWDRGYKVGKTADGNMGLPIEFIGKNTVLTGRITHFVTRMDNDLDGNPRAVVARFVVPVQDMEDEDEEDAFADSSSNGDGTDEFHAETTSNPEPEPEKVEKVEDPWGTEESEEGEPVKVGAAEDTSDAQDLDDDDPWS